MRPLCPALPAVCHTVMSLLLLLACRLPEGVAVPAAPWSMLQQLLELRLDCKRPELLEVRPADIKTVVICCYVVSDNLHSQFLADRPDK
jgi:hypothetical protein